MQIDATIPYRSLGYVLPNGMRQEQGSIIPSPDGTTLRYDGMIEYRGADIAPVVQFVMDVASGATAAVIAAWLVNTLHGRAVKVTIDRREVNLDDEGNVRQVIDERIKIERK